MPSTSRMRHACCMQPGRDVIPHEQRNLRQGLISRSHRDTVQRKYEMNNVHLESSFEFMPRREVDSPFTTCGKRNVMLEENDPQLAREA